MTGRRQGNRRPDSRRLTAAEAEDAARRAIAATEAKDAEIRARPPNYTAGIHEILEANARKDRT